MHVQNHTVPAFLFVQNNIWTLTRYPQRIDSDQKANRVPVEVSIERYRARKIQHVDTILGHFYAS